MRVLFRSWAVATVLLLPMAVIHANEEPQYGGTLNVATVYVTLSALSWDPADWTWKSNHDAGNVREQLFAADLSLSTRNGGPFPYVADAYLPTAAIRGELAERWVWETPLRLAITLRKEAQWQAKPGMMSARPIEAADVVFTYEYLRDSPKRIPTYFSHIDKVEARDARTVVFHFNTFNAEWDYRFGWGYYSSIIPRESQNVDMKRWQSVTGTGPFSLERYVHGNSHLYHRNPNYWDTESLNGTDHALPFVDAVKYRIIKDEATYLTALRTGKIDILETIRWIAVDHLKETTPELRWNRRLSTNGNFIALRNDQAPFNDERVRRALNLAVNQQEIAELFYGGHAELMAYPQHPAFGEYFVPLEQLPERARELYEYDPKKAKALLAEAGYAEGFTFKLQMCSCNPSMMDLVPLLEDYFSKVDVRIEIQPLEYASFLSTMTTRNHGPGYLMNSGHVNPTTTLRKNFITNQTWNAGLFSDPTVDARIAELHAERNEAKRRVMIQDLTAEMIARAPYVWLPIPYLYTAWWPWVKNYGGELRAGAVRPGPIYARLWIDQQMKRDMGFQ